jgi:hypothetical protein
MSDEELRSLERDWHPKGGFTERLALARALDRAGRQEDAFELLLDGVGDASVRREITRYPARFHASVDGGNTRWRDVRPLTRAPRLRFAAPPVRTPWLLRVAPNGVLISGYAGTTGDAWACHVLDPLDGHTRFTFPVPRGGPLSPEILGDAVVAWEAPDVVTRDVFTGEVRSRVRLEGDTASVSLAGLAHGFLTRVASGELSILDLGDESAPALEPRWSIRQDWFGGEAKAVCAVTPGKVLVQLPERLLAFSLERGERLFAVKDTDQGGADISDTVRASLRADAATIAYSIETIMYDAASATPSPYLVALDWKGEPVAVCRERRQAQAHVLAPGYVLSGDEQWSVGVVDRAHGTYVNLLDGQAAYRPACGARDVVYLARDRSLVAMRTAGTLLWEIDGDMLLGGPRIKELGTLPGRLYGLTEGGSVFCLEEGAL